MNRYSATIKVDGEMITIKRITKAKARKIHDGGQKIFVLAHKLYPCQNGMGYPWQTAMHDYPNIDKVDFNAKISNYIWYNCNWETGYYPSYYIQEAA